MMMELALQVVGMKLTGKVDDARKIAQRIVNSNQSALSKGMAPVSRYHIRNLKLIPTVMDTKATKITRNSLYIAFGTFFNYPHDTPPISTFKMLVDRHY